MAFIVYQEIYDNELKKAYPRNNNYSKDIEIYSNLENLELFPSLFAELNYFYNNSIFDIFNYSVLYVVNYDTFINIVRGV